MNPRSIALKQGSPLRAFLTPRWLFTTLLVLLAAMVMVRLGIWQLDRLEQRRARNALIQQAMGLPPLDLNQANPSDWNTAIYRDAIVTGKYDFSSEVVLRNQIWENRPGFHLLTPLLIEGRTQAVIVDRGWIPLEDGDPSKRTKYAEEGSITVRGRLMPSQQTRSLGGAVDAPRGRLDAWNWIDLPRLSQQMNVPIAPLYLIAAPLNGQSLPARSLPEPDLSEGPHMGYALQWFSFAFIFLAGYPFYVRKHLRSSPS
ncbi:uncharacterized conserved protein [Anaerolinea thermolimosa]|uniref:SURF1 family protein n=1 Tax=Anaerolinea thermolimosa TaxID=229919 RepID=UPI000780FFE6|nr:SURF1 family protein [Anaerolinea thermolimosa]GAP05465.1 uncharacterized conserved protein [Anaerolinea thermolimosa]